MSAPTTWAATEDNIGGNKVDDRVRMFRNASGHDGEFGTVRALDRDHGWRVWVHPDGAPYGLAVRMDPDDLERIVAEVDLPDVTPAPLDPSKVKAGDTVTVEVIPLHGPRYSLGGEVYRVDMSGPLWVGPVSITAPDEDIVRITLTDHQPAPEPEWKPGTVGTATVAHLAGGSAVLDMRVMRVEWDGLFGFATQTGRIIEDGSTDWRVYDLVPDEPRPLPTRDDLARIMHDDYLPNGEPRLGRTHREILADAVLAHLRGESR